MWGVSLKRIEFERRGRGEKHFRFMIPRLDISTDHTCRVPIMGPSGAGKSTLMNIMAGVVWQKGSLGTVEWRFPNGATFSWGGEGPRPKDLILLRRRFFGYAFQSATLQPHLTIGENLVYRLELLGVARPKAEARAQHLLQAVFGAEPDYAAKLLGRFESEVSGGERQRIALMQALIHDPYVLFADEPTGSLDQQTRREVMALLHRWLNSKPKERLLIWVTHHENDPLDNHTKHRIEISEQSCRWQIHDGSAWADKTFEGA